MQELLTDQEAHEIFALLAAQGFETRFIGGCVRDSLLGRALGDIDLATTATPEQVMACMAAAQIRTIPTGLAHGTVTILLNGRTFETTTLRRDVNTDGRHAKVVFSSDWAADAARRDFTVNALSVDRTGKLHDYFNGQSDLRDHRLRFIGNADQRVQEDYLRILRFFRFAAQLNWSATDGTALSACGALAKNLPCLSRERIQSELYKLVAGLGCRSTVVVMEQYGILALLSNKTDIAAFERIVDFETSQRITDPFRRLLALVGSVNLPMCAVLTSKQKKRLQKLVEITTVTGWALPKQLYYFGAETVLDYYLLANEQMDISFFERWLKPVFPLQAADILHLTNGPGSKLGLYLKDAEEYWVKQEFQPSKNDLVTYLTALTS